MPEYRLYFMTADGHVGHATEFICGSDDEAIHQAEKRRGEQPLELWSGARVVAKIPGRKDA